MALIKKIIAAMLAVLLAVTAVSCSKSPAGPTSGPSETYGDSLIEESLSEEGSVKLFGQTVNYSYHLPQLVGDSAEIAKINKQLEDNFGSIALEQLNAIESGDEPVFTKIGYNSFWQGSLLSLVVDTETLDGSESYFVVHYDFAKDKTLNTSDILRLFGTDEDSFVAAAKRAVADKFDSLYDDVDIDDGVALNDYYRPDNSFMNAVEMRSASIRIVNAEDAVVYPDGDRLMMIAPVGQNIAGGENWAFYALPVDLSGSFAAEKTVSDGAVTATLRDNRVFLSFSQVDGLDWHVVGGWGDGEDISSLPGSDFLTGGEYEVEGLYSTYTDIFLGYIGYDYAPHVILVTDSGRLQYINVFAATKAGVLCAMPIPGRYDFAGSAALESGVEVGQMAEYDTVYVKSKNGSVNLAYAAFIGMESVPSGSYYATLAERETDWGSIPVLAQISVYGDGTAHLDITELDAVVASFDGWLSAVGMTEYGIVCSFDLWPYDGGVRSSGAVLCLKDPAYTDYEGNPILSTNVISGRSPYGLEYQWVDYYVMPSYDYD